MSSGPYSVVQEYFKLFQPGDLVAKLAEVRKVFTDDCSYDETADPETVVGVDNMIEMLRGYHEVFPDMTLDVKEVLETDDTAIVVVDWTATHSAEFFGRPATGKKVTARNVMIYRCNEDCSKIRHMTIGHDVRTYLDQIDA